jgi:hypothetical protein
MSDTGWPVVVVGGGAAGLMAAILAAEGGQRVLLLERTPIIGKKILIAGGGRCNVLPSQAHTGVFVTDSPRSIVEGILRAWPLAEQVRFFERDLGVRLKREVFATTLTPPHDGVILTSRFGAPGKLFPVSDQASEVRDALVDAAQRASVTIRTGVSVEGIDRSPKTKEWRLEIRHGGLEIGGGRFMSKESSITHHPSPITHHQSLISNLPSPIFARRVILATGGLSVPSTGSDGTGLCLAETLGHGVTPPYPALTPLLGGSADHHALSGVSLPARLTAGEASLVTEGGFLFTHRGYSGPVVLNVSHTVARALAGQKPVIRARWGDRTAEEWTAALVNARGGVLAVLKEHVPERWARQLVTEAGLVETQRAAELRRPDRQRLLELLTRYPLPITGDEGYRKAEVTGGGVRLDEVDPMTLESRHCPGLYLCGEMLDVFGPIGGYNFLWAWASGYVAGRGATQR